MKYKVDVHHDMKNFFKNVGFSPVSFPTFQGNSYKGGIKGFVSKLASISDSFRRG